MPDHPAFPIFVDRYLLDTYHLADAEHGRYLLLLMTMWVTPDQRLPNNDEWLARKFRRTVDEVRTEFRPIIKEFCQTSGNWITQKRLLKVRDYRVRQSKQQSDNAKSRWNKDKVPCHDDAARHGFGNASNPIQSSKNPPYPPTGDPDSLFAALIGVIGSDRGASPRLLDTSPISRLMADGYSLETVILPKVKALAATRPKLWNSWEYVAKIIRSDAAPGPNGNAPPTDRELWAKRIETARKLQQWDAKWGPMPGQPGCRVPAELLRGSDGTGWTEWRPAA